MVVGGEPLSSPFSIKRSALFTERTTQPIIITTSKNHPRDPQRPLVPPYQTPPSSQATPKCFSLRVEQTSSVKYSRSSTASDSTVEPSDMSWMLKITAYFCPTEDVHGADSTTGKHEIHPTDVESEGIKSFFRDHECGKYLVYVIVKDSASTHIAISPGYRHFRRVIARVANST
ncbi:hypothetical protein GGX14DRAFT_388326 [Mycena pura]|uniref:Uncharacterized protein n=1 Tax=Mycena pura TaxID=153505 RepID=A0AAD7E0F6_9AGAR|nr:hypothetical protein GGX14DRAFT_388326 [Mycena pura]